MDQETADRYLDIGEQAERGLSAANPGEWVERLESDHDMINQSLAWFRDHGQPEKGTRFACALVAFWNARGYFREGIEWLDTFLSAGTAQTGSRAKALGAAARLSFRQGNNDAARRYNTESLSLSRSLDDPENIATALGGLAQVGLRDGDLEAVRRFATEGLQVARRTSDPRRSRVFPLHCLAEGTRMAGDFGEARRLYEESLELNRGLGNTNMMAVELFNLGQLEMQSGDPAQAREKYAESLSLSRQIHSLYLIPYGIIGLGRVAAAKGDAQRAAALFAAAEHILQSTGQLMDPADRVPYEESLAAVRRSLTSQALQDAWQRGQAMTIDEAIPFALTPDQDSSR